MSISYEALLGKMEKELRAARQSGDEASRRNHIYALKTLAEVMLEEKQSKTYNELSKPIATVQHTPIQQSPSVSLPSSEPIETDDGANGDSIFDF